MVLRLAFVVLFTCRLFAQSNQQVSTSVQQGYRIAGVLVNWVTGQPVAGASVAIAPTAQGADREISKTVITGSDGRSSLPASAAGSTL